MPAERKTLVVSVRLQPDEVLLLDTLRGQGESLGQAIKRASIWKASTMWNGKERRRAQ